MALPHLTDEEIRTWTPEQKDRWWFENVFRGNMPQLTLRSALTGFVIGGLLSATNLYIGAKTGWSLGVGVTSVIVSFAVFRIIATIGAAKDLTILENNAVQSIATAAGYMTSPLISSLLAYMFIIDKPLPWYQIMVWCVVAAVLGVLVAFPMKRRFVNNEQLPFPEGRACAVVLDSLYPHAPEGGMKQLTNAAAKVVDPAKAAMGVLMAKSLFIAAAISGFIKLLMGEETWKLVEGKWLGMKNIIYLPESLFGWYYALAAKHDLWIPRVAGIDVRQLAINPTFDLTMIGAGGLMGPRIANSLLLGCIVNYLILAPIMIHAGQLPPETGSLSDLAHATFGRKQLLNSWCLWWGVSTMVAASLAGLFARPQIIISAFAGLFGGKEKREDILKNIEFPLWVSLVGVPAVVAVSVVLNYYWFDVPMHLGLLSIPLIIALTMIAANATGLTSTTPTGALSKISQFTFGAMQPKNAATNLITAGMTSEVAGNASNLLMDIKPGYMLGAKPRQQAWGHIIGVFSGAIASTPLFFILLLPHYKTGDNIEKTVTDKFAVPGAVIWKAVADLIKAIGTGAGEAAHAVTTGVAKIGGVLPYSAAYSMIIAAGVAVIFEVLRITTKGRFPLSAVGIGLGVVIPPESTFMMWFGAMFFWMMGQIYRKPGGAGHRVWVGCHEPICAGIIAGAAILGIVDAVIGALPQ